MAKEAVVKNVVLVGQAGTGKTMLAEAMLHLTGKTSRLGGHAGTKPTLDYDGHPIFTYSCVSSPTAIRRKSPSSKVVSAFS